MTTTDTTNGTDTTDTADAAAVEPQPAVADETTPADTEGAKTADATPEGASGVDEDQDDGEDAGDGPGREAAKYRRRLRAAEAERDRLAGQVESLQRAEVDRLAAGADLRPAALWASGPELADLLTENGTVDQAKVFAAVAVAREQLGIPNPPPRRNYVKGEGRSPGRPAKPSGLDAMVAVVRGRDGSDG